ncbi:MAG: lipocalin family protein [Alphaproteobacteria bacterium]
MNAMRSLTTTIVSCVLFLSAGQGGQPARAADFPPRVTADLMRLAGSWYELARTPNRLADVIQRKNGKKYSACYNVKVDYSVESPRKVRITSSCTRQSPEGDVMRDVIDGVALLHEAARKLKFKVAFGSAALRGLQRLFTGGGKLISIYCLGPVNGDGRYEWFVSGDPEKRFVFLLSRNRTVSEETRAGMLACARKHGVPLDRLMFLQR